MTQKIWKLSPSDFAFLWEECKRCFYLKVAQGFQRPFTPFPKIFTIIAALEKDFFDGKSTTQISSNLPPGKVVYGEKYIRSEVISFDGVDGSCYISGRFDNVVEFEDGSYGVIDFKTAETKAEHVGLYSRQLHAYAYTLEHAAGDSLYLSPVTKLGLLCLEPNRMYSSKGKYGLRCKSEWIECPRDDEMFLGFIKDVLDVLSADEPPGGSPTCSFCQYRDTARRTQL